MQPKKKLLLLMVVLLLSILACTTFNQGDETPNTTNEETSPTAITEGGYDINTASADEPVLITGTIPFTSPFFINLTAEPFVLLEDQAGFVARDLDFEFPLPSQTIGPVWQVDEQTMEFSLSLPSVPQGTLLDVDNNGGEDQGVMIFQVAFWSNTWGGPFLEEREGTGWSGSYTSALTDPDRDYEIFGGKLVIWAPDDQQSFPTGFGADNMLFTEDDPVAAVPAGYSIVDLDSEPFSIYKEATPEFILSEGPGEVKDYSDMSFADAFDTLFERISIEYPFTVEKNIDWDGLYAEFAPKIEAANSTYEFYQVMHEFVLRIPDAHVGLGFNDDANQYFYMTNGASFGMVLAELSDERVIVTDVLPGYAAEGAGIEVGAEIINWGGKPIQTALGNVQPFFGPYSTEQAKRFEQLVFLTRYPDGTKVNISYQNPGGEVTDVTMTATVEYDSLFEWIPYFEEDPVQLPVQAEMLDGNIAYLKISTFSDDYNLMAQTYQRYIENLIDNDINGLIIDLRVNLGGSGGLAANFYGYFINEEIPFAQNSYYNHDLGEFEYDEEPATLEPAPEYYDGPIAVLVSPYCVSACEGFAYWLTLNDRATIVGNAGTAGAFGEVGRGQYTLPGDLDMQIPTGRPETLDGQLLIEGVGVQPDIVVPVTEASALGLEDNVLNAAINALLGN
ncbi:PDZ domain-containing protein [bacterium]|nr:PDZ domain-containing protein [bacterium]MCB2179303.1 PDZ domain-containing protein [bacterium]